MALTQLLLLAAATLAIGVCLGLSGYGGFLVPPLLVWLAGFDDPSRAVAHALLAALAPAVVGAALYRRHHRTPGPLTLLLCAGTVPGIVAGRLLTSAVPDTWLRVLIGCAVLAAGVALVARPRDDQPPDAHSAAPLTRPSRWSVPVGLTAGLLSGMAGVVVGVGGPLVTTPVLMSTGVALAPAVGAGLTNSVVVSVLGAASLLDHVTLDVSVLLPTALPQLVGVVIGVRLHSRVDATLLTRIVSVLAVVVGLAFIVHRGG
jgi:uncharacterized membrane protein YfcA